MNDLMQYIKFANKDSTKQQLIFMLNKIPERGGFDNLLPSQYMFLIKVYIGKILEMYDDPYYIDNNFMAAAQRRIENILKHKNIYLDDFSKMNRDTVLQDTRDVAKHLIAVYRNKREDKIGI